MINRYVIDLRSHLLHLWLYIVVISFFPAVTYFLLIYKTGDSNLNVAITIGGTFLLIYSIPLLTIHLNHYFYNRGATFEYDEHSKRTRHIKSDEEIEFGHNEINKITVFKSWPLSRNDVPIFAWDIYNYATIELNNGMTLKISSLLVN